MQLQTPKPAAFEMRIGNSTREHRSAALARAGDTTPSKDPRSTFDVGLLHYLLCV